MFGWRGNKCWPRNPWDPFCRRGGSPSGGLYPFSNSAGGIPPALQQGMVQGVPVPVLLRCQDALTPVPFNVPVTSSVAVSGGGPALQNAINAAAPGTNLVIQDSLTYSQVLISNKIDLTISAAHLQSPIIAATPGVGNNCVRILGGNSGLRLSGLMLVGTGNGGGNVQQEDGLINGSQTHLMASIDRVIVEDCTFQESDASVTQGAPAIQLIGTDGTQHKNVWIHRCLATNCGSNPNAPLAGYGTFEVSGFSNVFMQNSKVTRTDILPRASSFMRGFCWKSINVLVEDCITDDIGIGAQDSGFKHHEEAAFGTAVGNSRLRNCVSRNTRRGYRITLAGAVMTVVNCVAQNNVFGISDGQTLIRQDAGQMIFRNGIVLSVGDGIAFDPTVTEDHNDVFGVASNGKVLDPSDISFDPAFEDPMNGDFFTLQANCQVAASDGGLIGIRYVPGEKLIWCNH
jgi:hypothetical protein